MDPLFSQYTMFIITLYKMRNEEVISEEEYNDIKKKLKQKNKTLLTLIANSAIKEQESTLKLTIKEYIKQNSIKVWSQPFQNGRLIRGSGISVSAKSIYIKGENKKPTYKNPNSFHLQSLITQFKDLLQNEFSRQEKIKIQQFRDMINEYLDDNDLPVEIDTPKLCNQCLRISGQDETNSHQDTSGIIQKQQYNQLIINNIRIIYRKLKKIFSGSLHTHLLLMQQEITYSNLFKVVKNMIKTLTDTDNIGFVIRRKYLEEYTEWDFYFTDDDEISSLNESSKEEFFKIVSQVKPNSLYHYTKDDPQVKFFQNFQNHHEINEMSILRFVTERSKQEAYMFFVWQNDNNEKLQRKFIKQANEYGFKEEVISLANFLVDIILQTRVQYFSPLQFSDQIQDIALSFVGISRYILLDGIIKSLEVSYCVRKEQAFSENGIDRIQGDNQVQIEFSGRNPITLVISDMDLNNPADLEIYTEVIKTKKKFDQYMRLCNEKTAYYKYFIRSSDSLLFDFDRSGRLLFLSHPIWTSLLDKYKINYCPEKRVQTYDEIFEDEKIRNLIDLDEFFKMKSNQYVQNDEFEIFIRIVDYRYKGFTVIFHLQEGKRVRQYMKNLKIDEEFEREVNQSIQRSYNKHQTFKFINQLEQNNPGVKNTMISLFIPEETQTQNSSKDMQKSGFRKNRVSISLIDKQLQIKSFNKQAFYIKSISSMDEQEIEDDIHEPDILDQILDQFNFNILTVDDKAKPKLVYEIIRINNFIEQYQINSDILASFIKEIEKKYNKRNNKFHNFDHGVAVMQCAHFLCNLPTINLLLSDIVQFSTIISALCHDVDHTGRTNQFEINSRSKLALRYLDKSPLEQHHASTTLKLLQNPTYNIIENVPKEEQNEFRQILIENILYTDMKEHFTLIKDFESRIKESQENSEKYFGSMDGDIKLLTGMIIHSSDFGGGAKQFSISRIWSERVNSEFKCQYIEEGNLDIPQTPFFKDLDQISVMAKCEMNFSKVIVRPLWALLNEFTNNDLKEVVSNIDNTIIQWETIYSEAKSQGVIENENK